MGIGLGGVGNKLSKADGEVALILEGFVRFWLPAAIKLLLFCIAVKLALKATLKGEDEELELLIETALFGEVGLVRLR